MGCFAAIAHSRFWHKADIPDSSAFGAKRTSASDCLPITIYEYTPFCNGPGDVKSPRVMVAAAELTLLSVVDAEAATLCCQRER